jgi:uncharacterized protein (TIGR00251 family)
VDARHKAGHDEREIRAIQSDDEPVTVSAASFCSPVPDGIAMSVRVTPKGGRDSIDGVAQLADGRSVLKVRVRAAASDGEANAAVVKLLARTLGVAPSGISVTAGETARVKRLKIAGDGAALTRIIDNLPGVRP